MLGVDPVAATVGIRNRPAKLVVCFAAVERPLHSAPQNWGVDVI